jgi:hypothetical protein
MTTTYTLEEAQALLPEAKRRIGEASAILADLRAMLQTLRDGRAPASTTDDAAALEAGFDRAMAWFTERGIQVKGLDPALLDFPARAVLDGASIEVLLCWRDDEDAIAYYHPATSGYRGREPIAMLDRV